MPTKKPRISITLEADDLACIDRYAAAAGTPRATILAGLITSAVPELTKAAGLIEIANEAPLRVRRQVVEDLSNATADALGFLAPFNRDYHVIMNNLQAELYFDKPKRRDGWAGGRAAPDAPIQPGAKRPKNPRSLTGGSK